MTFKKTILVALLISAVGCIKQPELEDDDGIEASAEAVQKSLADAWGEADPGSAIRLNEFSYTELSQRIHGVPAYDPARVMYLEGLTVTSREVKTDDIEYKIVQQVSDRTGTESKVSSTEYQVSVPRMDAVQATTLESAVKNYSVSDLKPMSLSFGVQIVSALAHACTKSSTWDADCAEIKADKCDLTCHNLVIKTETVPAPKLVQDRANCEGLENCQIRTVKVSFDQILKIKKGDNTEKSKVGYSVVISPDVPYLSRLMSQCSRRLLTISASNQKVLGEVCNDVKDFQAGTPH